MNIQTHTFKWRLCSAGRENSLCAYLRPLRFWVSQSPRPNKSHRSYSDLVLSLAEVNQQCCLTVTVCLVGIKAKPKGRSCPHLFINSLFLTFLFSKASWEVRPDTTRQVARSLNTLWVKRREITSKNPSYVFTIPVLKWCSVRELNHLLRSVTIYCFKLVMCNTKKGDIWSITRY